MTVWLVKVSTGGESHVKSYNETLSYLSYCFTLIFGLTTSGYNSETTETPSDYKSVIMIFFIHFKRFVAIF